VANDELIHGGVGSPNSNRSVTRRWMERLVRPYFFAGPLVEDDRQNIWRYEEKEREN
jgi:hypothetical protein